MFSPFCANIKITVTQNLPTIINVDLFCNFKAGNVSFDKTVLWCYTNIAISKIILVQNKLEKINFSC